MITEDPLEQLCIDWLREGSYNFQQYLLEGIPIEYTGKNNNKQSDHVQLIDFHNPDNNQFPLVNQFTRRGAKINRRPEVMVFYGGVCSRWSLQ